MPKTAAEIQQVEDTPTPSGDVLRQRAKRKLQLKRTPLDQVETSVLQRGIVRGEQVVADIKAREASIAPGTPEAKAATTFEAKVNLAQRRKALRKIAPLLQGHINDKLKPALISAFVKQGLLTADEAASEPEVIIPVAPPVAPTAVPDMPFTHSVAKVEAPTLRTRRAAVGATQTVLFGGDLVAISPTAYKFLELLSAKKGVQVDRQMIMRAIGKDADTTALGRELRAKFGENAFTITGRGRGGTFYTWHADVNLTPAITVGDTTSVVDEGQKKKP